MREKKLNLFSVPIQMNELELNTNSLIEFCYEIKRKNEKGAERSNIGGWQSDNVINEPHIEFVKLKNKIEEVINSYHNDIQFKKTYNQTIDKIWININQKGQSNVNHVHPFSCLAGVFYLTKENSPIVFCHPYADINTYYWYDELIEEWNEVNSAEWTIEPEPNMLIVFPSWLWHKVTIHKKDTDRISLSFNTNVT